MQNKIYQIQLYIDTTTCTQCTCNFHKTQAETDKMTVQNSITYNYEMFIKLISSALIIHMKKLLPHFDCLKGVHFLSKPQKCGKVVPQNTLVVPQNTLSNKEIFVKR